MDGGGSSLLGHLAPEEDTLVLPPRLTPIDPAEENIAAAEEHKKKVIEMLSALHKLEDKIEEQRHGLQTLEQQMTAFAFEQEIRTRSAELRREHQVARQIVEREREISMLQKTSTSYRQGHPRIQQRLHQLQHQKEQLREARRLREQQQALQNNNQDIQ